MAVVSNAHAYTVGCVAEGEAQVVGVSVAESIGDGFLADAQEVGLNVFGEGIGGAGELEFGLDWALLSHFGEGDL